MKKSKMGKTIKWIAISLIGLMLVPILGLIANNRVMAMKYNKLDTNTDVLTNENLSAVEDVYEYLQQDGYTIFDGLGGNTDLIIYNDQFEFLICDDDSVPGWRCIGNNAALNKNIFSRNADNPQAFAVLAGDTWIGSMSTKDTFNKAMVNTVPFFFPPQFVMIDDAHYRGLVIHEMVHAYEANNNNARFMQIQSIHDVCEDYYGDQAFNELIAKEAYYLEQAITAAAYEDVLANTGKFIEMRERRRTECQMSMSDIQDEMDFEWLEGLARYAEYKASSGSNSLVAKNLIDIDQKVKVKSDERYYTLGMAQALVLDKLKEDWKNDIFTDGFSMEACIKGILE